MLNLGVNLALVRVLPPHEYGAFVFWANAGFVLASLQNAISTSHLYVLAPDPSGENRRQDVEVLMHAVTYLWLGAVFVLALGAGLMIGRHDDHLSASTAAIFLPAFLLQQYVRALAFSRGEPAVAAAQTGLVLLLSIVFLAVSVGLAGALHADAALGSLAAAYGVAGLLGAWRATRGQWRGWRWRNIGRYSDYIKNSGWIFVGVTSTEMLVRFYSFIVAGWFGAAALAGLSASQLLMRPIPLLAGSWSMVARTELARRRDAGQFGAIGRISALASLGGLAITLVWTAGVYTAWPLISRVVFDGKYADLGWMTLVWGVSAGLSFVQVALSSSLQILRAFKTLALANTAAAIVAVAAIVGLMRLEGAGGAVMGNACGQAVEAVLMVWLLSLYLRRMAQRQTSA